MSNIVPVDGVYRITTPSKQLSLDLADDGSQVFVNPFDAHSNSQKWSIRRVDGEGETYRITSLNGQFVLSWKSEGDYDGYGMGYLAGVPGATTEWILDSTSSGGTRMTATDKNDTGQFVDSRDEKTVHFWPSNPDGVNQHWVFEQAKAKSFTEKFFPFTVADAAKEEYDIIIVGSGIGGGVLANDLYDTNMKMGAGDTDDVSFRALSPEVFLAPEPKSILLLEKGSLVFHSHCLNTARPAGLDKDRGQQNDTFFNDFKEEFKVFSSDGTPLPETEWKGGPMYNLGGRSAAWGLFAPRVHDKVLKDRLPLVAKDLVEEYYDKAELLMKLSSPETKRVHQHLMDRLNMVTLGADSSKLGLQWEWGRIASEFRDSRNFDFAEGAYSSIDKIIEIAMSRPKSGPARSPVEHKYFKTVLNADVRALSLDGKTATGVQVKDAQGKTYTVKLKREGNVVLAAGSVNSPAILLRSPGITHDDLWHPLQNGLRLTDHDIWFYDRSFTYTDPTLRNEYGAMKLQSYATIGDKIMLLNMSIDASSFLPRGKTAPGSHAQFIFVFMTQSSLVETSDIRLESDEPKVTMDRGTEVTVDEMATMRKLTAETMNCLRTTAKISFQGILDDVPITLDDIKLKPLQLGGVAHELGTLPMKTKTKARGYCVDENLKLKPSLCHGVHVCDLSVFPMSPEANPTLTLAALAIRLSRHLIPRRYVQPPAQVPGITQASSVVQAVNHTGQWVQVWLTFRSDTRDNKQPEEPRVLPPGAWTSWERPPKFPQGLFIYRLDDTAPGQFVKTPTLMTALPDKVNAILF